MAVREEIIFARAIKTLEAAYLPLGAGAIAAIRKYWHVVHVKKGKVLYTNETTEKKCWFIVKGALRVFYLQKQKEISLQFIFEGNFVGTLDSRLINGSNSITVEAMENSTMMELDHEAADLLARQFNEIDTIRKSVVNASVQSYQQHLMSILFETAEDRYDNLLKNAPWIIERVALRHIASNIGISSETLSRIRRKKKDDRKKPPHNELPAGLIAAAGVSDPPKPNR